MKVGTLEISVTELQQALRDWCGKHARSQPHTVLVDNGFDKIVLAVPLAPGAVINGSSFACATEID